jgi:hypothetical protein
VLPGLCGTGLRIPRVDQRVEMTTDTGGRDTQPFADIARGDRTFEQQLHDGRPGVTF